MPTADAHFGQPELLIADDDSAMLDLLTRVFSKDFRVRPALDGQAALDWLQRTKPAAILVDEMMPHATGTEVLEAAKAAHPRAVRMLMTAHHDFEKAVAAVNQGEIHRFFPKPIRPTTLRTAVREIVAHFAEQNLLHIELETLKNVHAGQSTARVLLIGALSPLTDALRMACELRGYHVEHEVDAIVAPAALMRSSFDLVIVTDDGVANVGMLVDVVRVVNERTAIALAHPEPDMLAMRAAFEYGAADFFSPPDLDVEHLAGRIERAVHGSLAARDMQRLTRELLTANRDLELARRATEDAQLRVLKTMIRTLEARDPYTAGHTDRVAAIAVRLAERMALDPDRIDRIRVGALVHDIGKVGIPDAVLLKPGKLTAEEYELIKKHPAIGHDLLSDIPQFSDVLPHVRHHHERIDGKGYPDGLAGDALSLEVRIIAVADVFDAITSDRPYRPGSSITRGFEIIDTLVGHHLDARVVHELHALHAEGRLAPLLQEARRAELEGPAPASVTIS